MGFDSTLKTTSERIEDLLEKIHGPVKPHLPAISRFLIVATFFEDGFRIMWQWRDQIHYLQKVRHFTEILATLFLAFNSASMILFATCIILNRLIPISVAILATVVIGQAVAYGLVFDTMFFLRNLSITGGLLLCLSESILRHRSKKSLFASLPQMSEDEKHKYYQLAGRILLVFLFIGFVFKGEWSMERGIVSVIGFIACGMVIVGFRAKSSATFLVTILCIANLFVNNWWSVHHSTYTKDFLRYDFFQCLSIQGGLLLLVHMGPGRLSYDEKKKKF
ncbi:SURF4 family-domain-containing protein [Pilobolus umbonatus]|nr:SURF4 family-domain-containing protein [Pilobolus umbonatus]